MRPLALVVEPDPGTQRLLQALLARRGVEVDVAADPVTATRLIDYVGYSAAVVDLAAGEELVDHIEQRDERLLAHTIALTTRAIERRPHRVRMLRKPFEIVDLDAAFAAVFATAPGSEPTFTRDFSRRSILLGAKSGIAARLRVRKGVELEHVASFGYTHEVLDRWFPIAASAELPMCAAVRRSRPIFLPTTPAATTAYPAIAAEWEHSRSHAAAAVPVHRRGRVVGVLGWSFSDTQTFDATAQAMLSTMADSFADALG
jgi:GAF domain-containing protein